jgi:hypothetical protein
LALQFNKAQSGLEKTQEEVARLQEPAPYNFFFVANLFV